MAKGKIKVQTENIFPIIKKFLYSDHEIFLRELIANATDATKKLHTLASLGEFKGDIGNDTIEIILDKKAKTLTVKDKGIGMSEEEIKKYINQIAFSGAEEFVNKFKDKTDTNNIIGKFGLGFYSSFMVAERVEILSKNYKDAWVQDQKVFCGDTNGVLHTLEDKGQKAVAFGKKSDEAAMGVYAGEDGTWTLIIHVKTTAGLASCAISYGTEFEIKK